MIDRQKESMKMEEKNAEVLELSQRNNEESKTFRRWHRIGQMFGATCLSMVLTFTGMLTANANTLKDGQIAIDDSKSNQDINKSDPHQRQVLSDSKVLLDGEEIKLNNASIQEEDQILVPLREVYESFGAKVNWIKESRMVEVVNGKNTYTISTDGNKSYLNGKEIPCPQVLLSDKGTTFISLNFVSESLGLESYYDIDNKELVLTSDRNVKIQFRDKNFEKEVREILNKPEGDIFSNDVKNITQLNIENAGIEDIHGIEYFKNLTELNLVVNQIKNISPLTNRTKLIELKLNNNYISDIGPLSRLVNLERLFLYGNMISDIGPLEGLNKIYYLVIVKNRINDISTLAKLPCLNTLLINYNPILDYSPLDSYLEKSKDDSNRLSIDDFNSYSEYDKYSEQHIPCYDTDIEKQKETLIKVNEILDNIITKDMTDLQKEKAIYDYIMDTATFNMENRSDGAYDILVEGSGVCHNYALAFDLLAAGAGLESYYVSGEIEGSTNGHAWNIVKIDGKYYHVDTTWDDVLPEGHFDRAYKYFNVSDSTMERMGRTWENIYPSCDEDMNRANIGTTITIIFK